MPDSPVDVKVPARSSATPPAMPPPPAAVAQGAPRASTYTPTAMINGGSSHSPTAASIGGSPSSPPHGYHGPSPSPSSGSSSSSSSLSSSTSSSASLSLSAASTLGQQQQQHHQSQHHHHHHHHNHHSNQQHHHHQQQHHPQQQHHQQPVPAACGARQLSKLKRFLATLQQFGSDISPEIGERVRGLVLGLVNSSVTIEEFHSKLQEATNFPLRPFVIPFLKANLPLLQRELLQCARTAKLSPAQYLAQNQFLLLDVGIPPAPPAAPLAPGAGTSSHGGGTMAGSHNHHHQHHHQHHQQHHQQHHHQHHPPHHGTATMPHHHHQQQQQHHHHQQQHQQHHDPIHISSSISLSPPALPVSRPEEVIDHRLTEREWAEEWKHLDHLLSCILEMVEKTRRAISVLRRCQETDRQELARWVRRCCSEEAADPPGASASAGPIGKKNGLGHVAVGGSGSTLDTHQEFLSRPGTRYMPEDIWRKAEEAVNDVKRRAMSELQKAVSDAERQARSTIEGERARMERALADAKRQAASDAIAIVARQDDSSESCWNCGRKASETCSGCNTARYCGAFCQHKDWERHHHVCGQRQQQQQPQKEQHRHHQQQQQQQPKVEPSPQPSADLIVQTAGSVKGGGGGGGGGGSSSSSSGGGGGRVGGSPDDGVIAAAVSAPPPPPPRPDSPIVVESAAAASR
ncbi:unnamed protein product [Lampetra planeri]